MTPKAFCPACGASDWGSRNRCKPCHARAIREHRALDPVATRAKQRAMKRAWRAANPEKERAANRRKSYGVDAPEFDEMLEAQLGVCRICKTPNPDCLDHDHATNQFRGVLCNACNAGLGLLRDDPGRMRAAAAYLAKFR